jgi:predicted transcriptional regulator
MSIKNQVLFLVKSQGEIGIDELRELSTEIRHKESCLERRARELVEAGLIEPIWAITADGVRYIAGYRSL